MKTLNVKYFLIMYPYGIGEETLANLHFHGKVEEPDVTTLHNLALRRAVIKLILYNDPSDKRITELKLDTARPTTRIVCKRMLRLFCNVYGSKYIKDNRQALEQMLLKSAKLAQ